MVTGRVLLAGNAMPHFGIAFRQPSVRLSSENAVIDDIDGRFTLRDLEAGTWQLTFIGPGTRAKRIEPITIERGQSVDLGDIHMERGRRIAGCVRDGSGASSEGARVFVGPGPGFSGPQTEIDRWLMGSHETRTDSSGAFVFDRIEIPEGFGPRLIWAMGSGGASIFREIRLDDANFELVLHRCGRIEGVVDGRRARHTVVFAKRADEPEQARRQSVGEVGEFRFEDVPAGDYEVSLKVPKTVHAPPVLVTVVDGRAATVKLTMLTSGVELTVTVPPGRGVDLVLASADSSTPEPELVTPRIVMIEPKITFGGVSTHPWTGKESIRFAYLQPGRYRASIDGETWTPIVVTASPQHQQFEIAAAE